MRTITFDAILL